MGFMRGLTIAAALLALAADAAAQRQQRRPVTEGERREANAALDAFTAPTLTRFGSEAEFRRYVEAARRFRQTRGRYHYAAHSGPRFAQAAVVGLAATQSDAAQPVCPPDQPDCLDDDGSEQVVVTGSRIPPPSNPSITNNQLRNVEEGDIVKQIGRFLLVLQDGRIFVVDTRAGGSTMALTDRADVYRDPDSDMWYDEMLVFGDRVLITGYSYDDAATELAVFRLGETGRLIREGVFRLSSNDYYSSGNYATRLIDGNLVTYSPLRVSDIAGDDFRWPVVRRWLPQDDARERDFQNRRRQNWRLRRDPPPAGLTPLIDAAGIYRPVRRTEEPMVHSVSVCPLASSDDGRDLRCRTTSFVAPEWPEWYVTETHVYLWTTTRDYGRECDGPLAVADSASALVYRVPHSGARPDFIAAHGMPPDQFAMQADSRRLYALVRLVGPGCTQRYNEPTRLAFFSLPLARFGPTLAEAPASAFTELPGTPAYSVASRFTDRYLVYGGLSGYRRYPVFADDEDPDYRRGVMERLRPRPAYVVPIGRPEAFRPLTIGHTVIRAERVADDILLTGYRDGRGLSLTLIGLDGRPRIASTALLPGRYESEGRSHAFNSRIDADGSGLMGLPTVRQVSDSDRDSWRSRASDLSFLALDTRRRLRPIGTLERRFDYVDEYDNTTRVADEDGVPGYQCEVSCIDWYGNSRPIFTDGRIFALSGAELIEGRIENGRIRELRRLNFALAPVPAR